MQMSTPEIAGGSAAYRAFVKAYKPKIRPENQLERVVKAFRLDVEFVQQFEIFRKSLKRSRIAWGPVLLSHLDDRGAFSTALSDEDRHCILSLYKIHERLFRVGRFDERYLNSVEDISLFFVHMDVKSVMIAGAYRELMDAHIDLVVSEVGKSQATPLAHSMKALTLALAFELNQIQRVFTMYERDVSATLIKDLSYGGMLTQMPTGKRDRSG